MAGGGEIVCLLGREKILCLPLFKDNNLKLFRECLMPLNTPFM